MGILDDIKGKVLGGEQSNVLDAVMGLLGDQQAGGLSGLVQQFAGKGLGDIVTSWVGLGQNAPITPQQVTQGLGADKINQLASKTGLSAEQVASQVSELLPKVVDKLTPDGKIPEGDKLAKGMDLLKGFLK